MKNMGAMLGLLVGACMIYGAFGDAGLHESVTLDHIDEIQNNAEDYEASIKCFREEGPCTDKVQKLKDVFPEIYKAACSHCSEGEKGIYKRGCSKVYRDSRDDFDYIVRLVDAEGIYYDEFVKFCIE